MDDLKNAWRLNNHPVIVIASTSEIDRLPVSILKIFKHEINLEVDNKILSSSSTFQRQFLQAPTEAERLALLSDLLKDLILSPDVSLKYIATQTAALLASDLVYLIDMVQTIAMRRTLDMCVILK